MADAVVLRVLCSRLMSPHVVGTVRRAEGNLELRYQVAVRVDGTGRDSVDFEGRDTVLVEGQQASGAFCRSCGQRYHVFADQVFESARKGRRSFKLQGMNADAAWRHRFGG
jgi:hypothetical protein